MSKLPLFVSTTEEENYLLKSELRSYKESHGLMQNQITQLESQLQAAQANLDLLRHPIEAIKAAGYENISHFIVESLIDSFKQSDAPNFITQEFVDDSGDEAYQFTISRVGGESTAAQLNRLKSELEQAKAKIKELEQTQEWISVENKIPYYGQIVLLKINNVVQEVTFIFDGADDCADWFEPHNMNEPEHEVMLDGKNRVEWLLLPPQPKE
jgi:prefoldin subunit 5